MLVDTSLLVRALQPQHPLCGIAKNAIDCLRLTGRRLYVFPQNLVELWVVATRPVGENGLGMSCAEALAELTRVKTFFALLPEAEEIFAAWERLVTAYQVSGKSATTRGSLPRCMCTALLPSSRLTRQDLLAMPASRSYIPPLGPNR